jgi:hypothetical protein
MAYPEDAVLLFPGCSFQQMGRSPLAPALYPNASNMCVARALCYARHECRIMQLHAVLMHPCLPVMLMRQVVALAPRRLRQLNIEIVGDRTCSVMTMSM